MQLPVSRGRPSALVVEDHAFQRRALCRLLERAGVERPLEAEDGESALAQLRAGNGGPMLVITDLDMPNMDGIEFIRRLAGEGLPLHLAIYSSQEQSLLRSVHGLAEDLGLQLVGVLQKPANLAQIEALLDSIGSSAGAATRPAPAQAMSVDEVREAFEEDWVVPWFQPKVSLLEERIVGSEVLARIAHPRRGILMPELFMSVLAAEGMQQRLTDRMLAGALAFLAKVPAEAELCVSVNLTLPEVSLPRDAERLAATVSQAGAAPRSVIFEVTETALATDWGLAVENLSRLRMKGFNLSIDDFGTGYSSLQQLLKLPFSELKLDQSFIRGLTPSSAAYPLVESTLGMAEKLGLTTVAEGVETSGEASILRGMGCDLGQGHAYGKPMPLEQFLGLLRA